MSIAELLIQRVEFSFSGQKWPLLFSHRALLVCEKLTGIDMLAASVAAPSAVLLRGLLFSALTCAGAKCSLDDVGRSIKRAGLRSVKAKVAEAWAASMPEPDPESKRDVTAKFTWIDAWASATSKHVLGLSDDEWLDMTPRQLSALQKLRLEQMQREELLVGIIASTVENFSHCHPDRPVSAASFMLHKLTVKEEPLTGEHIMAQMARRRK